MIKKKILSKKIFGKKICSKNFGKKLLVEIGFFVKKYFDPILFWIPTNLRSKNCLVLNMFGSMKLDPKLYYHKTILGSKKNWVQKKLGPKICLVKKVWFKIHSVTAEILLKMTNLARLHVAWTNFIMTADICYRWSQKADFEVWSKSGL